MKRLTLLFLLVILLAAGCNLPMPAAPEGTIPATGTADRQPVATLPVEPSEIQPPAQTAGPSATQPPAASVDDEGFDQALALALVERDFEALRRMMGEQFTLARWHSEGSELSADQAIGELRQVHLAEGSAPAVDFGADTTALLEGADPLVMMGGPNGNAVRAFFLDGLGPEALDEGIVIVSRDPGSGELYFGGILISAQGFTHLPQEDSPEQAFAGRLTQAIEAKDLETLESMMGESFGFATWNTQLLFVPPEEAVETLQQEYLVPSSAPVVRQGTDLTALLEGGDPLAVWGPVLQPVQALHVMGLAENGTQEAVLVTGFDPDSGELFWLGMLLPQGGYFQSTGAQ